MKWHITVNIVVNCDSMKFIVRNDKTFGAELPHKEESLE